MSNYWQICTTLDQGKSGHYFDRKDAEIGEWVTKLLGWLRCRFRNQGSREKRFKGKSRSIFEAKFLRRHFFADFLSRLVAASQNHDDEDDGEDDDEDDGEDDEVHESSPGWMARPAPPCSATLLLSRIWPNILQMCNKYIYCKCTENILQELTKYIYQISLPTQMR